MLAIDPIASRPITDPSESPVLAGVPRRPATLVGLGPLLFPPEPIMLARPAPLRLDLIAIAAREREATLDRVAALEKALATQRFLTSEAAVRATLDALNPLSMRLNAEIAFIVVRGDDGFRSGPFTVGNEGAYAIGRLDLTPNGPGTTVAVGHTHGAPYDAQACLACVNTERLSGYDRQFAERHHVPIYFSSPRGVFGVYDPATFRSTYYPEGTIRTR